MGTAYLRERLVAVLTTTGPTISKQVKFEKARIPGLVIGYGSLLIKHFGGRLLRSFTREKIRIGKKYHMQVPDFYMPQRTLKSF